MNKQSITTPAKPKRLIALDALRGFTIAAMIIVNDPGSWSHVYAPLKHAEWNGCTLTDLVFPFFLFVVGVSIALAALIIIVDLWGYTKWTHLGRVYGANAITSYVLAGMLTLVFYSSIFGGASLNGLFMDVMTGIGIAAKLASLMYAVIYTLIVYIPAYILYRNKIFIKV